MNANQAVINIPLPAPIDIKNGDIIENLKLFKENWNVYVVASTLEKEVQKRQVAVLLSAMGIECFKLFQNWPVTNEEKQSVDGIFGVLEKFLAPQTNKRYERAIFNLAKQESDEDIDKYINRLRKLVKNCEYGAMQDELVLDKLIVSIRDINISQKLWSDKKITLSEAIDIIRMAEVSRKQMNNLKEERTEEVKEVKQTGKKIVKRSKSANRSEWSCWYCGLKHNKGECPAKGKKCNKCGRYDHFAAVCETTKKDQKKARPSRFQKKKESVRQIEAQDLTDEYIFAINSIQNENLSATLTFNINGTSKDVVCQLDTGATCNVMGLENYKEIGNVNDINESTVKLKCFGGAIITPIGEAIITCMLNNNVYKLVFQLVEGRHNPLLSANACKKLKLIQMCHNINKIKEESLVSKDLESGKDKEAKKLLETYKDVFSGIGKLKKEITLTVDETITPKVQVPRRVPIALRDNFRSTLDDLEKMGIIRKVEESTAWTSNVVLVEKKDSKLRVCIDPLELNRALKRTNYQIPTIDEILPELKEAKVFSTFDARNGFWQLPLANDSQLLTTFWTPWGRYCWLRVPFGIAPAPEIFQKTQHELIVGLKGVEVIADDFLVFGKGENMQEAIQNHNENLEKFLQKLRSVGLTLNANKTRLLQTEVTYYGHLLTSEGLRADPSKISAIRRMPIPSTKKELQCFLGMVNYVNKFLPNLSTISEPLRILTHEKTLWNWTKRHETVFNTLKEMITRAPVLKYFNSDEQITLECDASSIGLGVALLQSGQPVAYASKTLTQTERKYAQIEKEALAIVFGCKRFDQYMCGQKEILIRTDHKPLVSIFKKSLLQAPKRLQRMMLALQRYKIQIKHVPGTQLHLADLLSRSPESNIDETIPRCEVFKIEELENFLTEVEAVDPTSSVPIADERIEKIKEATRRDEVLQKLGQCVLKGWPDKITKSDEEMRHFEKYKEDIVMQEGILFKGSRIIIPRELRQDILKRLHAGHSGTEATIKLARDTVFWPKINEQIKKCVSSCLACQETLSKRDAPMQSHKIPSRPFQRISMDTCEIEVNNRKYKYLITVDHYSDFYEIDELKDLSGKVTVELCKINFARHGIPDEVITDNATQFINEDFARFIRDWNFKHITSSPHYPKGNGKAEATVKIAKNLIKKTSMNGENLWAALLIARNTPNNIGTSPVQRLFSRRTKTTIPTKRENLQPKVENCVKDRIELRRRTSKMYYDRRSRRLPILDIGQDVIVKLKPEQNDHWTRGTIIEQLTDRSFIVKVGEKTYRRNEQHIKPTNEQLTEQKVSDDAELREKYQSPKRVTFAEETNKQEVPEISTAEVTKTDLEVDAHLTKPGTSSEVRRSARVRKTPIRFKDFC